MTYDFGLMYFGTKERMAWVKAPAPGAGFAAVGFTDTIRYQNGGLGMRNSKNAHLEYDMSWGSATRDQVAAIESYQYGLYGDGLIHFLDPVAIDRNLFNAQWAAPKLTAEDGIPLAGNARPNKVLIGDTSLDYPLYAAQYTVTPSSAKRYFYCPIPPGYTAWIGAHGVAQTQGLTVQPMLGTANSGGALSIPVAGVNTNTRFGGSVVGGGAIDGINISLNTSANATITLSGLMLQVLPTGTAPAVGGFITGRGNSGCVFEGKMNIMPYSIPGESIGMTAKLVEVGDWL
jgi:hypothetical protein